MRARGRHEHSYGRALAVLLTVMIPLTPTHSHAQPKAESPAETTLARRLFREAAELREKGDFAGAEAKLRETLEIKETAGVRLHFGHALAQTGKLLEALEAYDRVEVLIHAGAPDPELEQQLAAAREKLRARIPTITVTCKSACKLEAIVIDEKPTAHPSLGSPVPVGVGKHRVEVHAASRTPYTTEVQASEGDHLEITADWPDATPTATPPAKDTPRAELAPDSSSTKTLVLVGEGAFAIVGISLGLVFHDAARNAESRAVSQRAQLSELTGTSNSCAQPTAQSAGLCTELADTNDSRVRNDRFAIVSFALAGVGVGAMIATELLWKPTTTSRQTSRSPKLFAAGSPTLAMLGVMGCLP